MTACEQLEGRGHPHRIRITLRRVENGDNSSTLIGDG
jgi:hypothetical protein